MTNTIDTVIFDLDGTLVDSQPAALGATIEALSRFDVPVTEAELREMTNEGNRSLSTCGRDRRIVVCNN